MSTLSRNTDPGTSHRAEPPPAELRRQYQKILWVMRDGKIRSTEQISDALKLMVWRRVSDLVNMGFLVPVADDYVNRTRKHAQRYQITLTGLQTIELAIRALR